MGEEAEKKLLQVWRETGRLQTRRGTSWCRREKGMVGRWSRRGKGRQSN
jgi:hypothetical protein